MSKIEFMKELEALLLDIPMEERQEALQYYEGYFDDAGPDSEQSITLELGSPAKVAACIKADLNSSTQEAQSRGYFTEKGYEDENLQEPKYEMIGGMPIVPKDDEDTNNRNKANNSNNNARRSNFNSSYTTDYNSTNNNNNSTKYYANNSTGYEKEAQKNPNSGLKIGLIILLCLFALPVGIPIIVTVFGLFISAFFTIAGICLGFAIVSVVLLIVGICLAILGLIKLIAIPIVGICFAGVGLLLFGLGLLFSMATIWLFKKVLPAIFRFFIDICRLPFHNRRVMA